MNVALRRPVTLAAFLAWEERQEARWEFDGVAPVATTGGTLGHDAIANGIRAALRTQLAGKPCRSFGPDVKITPENRSRYPDAVVTCSPQSRRGTILQAPVVIFEVVSPGTSRTDRIEKVRDYLTIATVRRYIILEADSIGATMLVRGDAQWLTSTLVDGDVLDLPEIEVSFPLAEAYSEIDFGEAED